MFLSRVLPYVLAERVARPIKIKPAAALCCTAYQESTIRMEGLDSFESSKQSIVNVLPELASNSQAGAEILTIPALGGRLSIDEVPAVRLLEPGGYTAAQRTAIVARSAARLAALLLEATEASVELLRAVCDLGGKISWLGR